MKGPADEASFAELVEQARSRAESVLSSAPASGEERGLAVMVLELADRFGRSVSPQDSPVVASSGALDRLKRVMDRMADNAVSAEEAGLEGDARRWRVVREDVAAAVEELARADDV